MLDNIINYFSLRIERLRRRVEKIGPDTYIRRRLFDMEERRLAADSQRAQELTLIRVAVQQLCRALQNGFQEIIMEFKRWRREFLEMDNFRFDRDDDY